MSFETIQSYYVKYDVNILIYFNKKMLYISFYVKYNICLKYDKIIEVIHLFLCFSVEELHKQFFFRCTILLFQQEYFLFVEILTNAKFIEKLSHFKI